MIKPQLNLFGCLEDEQKLGLVSAHVKLKICLNLPRTETEITQPLKQKKKTCKTVSYENIIKITIHIEFILTYIWSDLIMQENPTMREQD